MKAAALALWMTAQATSAAAAASMKDYYTVESVATPEGIDPQIGGIDVLPDGRLAVAFMRGEVCFLDPVSGKWSVFARGLHLPLGIKAISATEVAVMQRPELTRLRDADGDGAADRYETVWHGFGMTGNYHEFAYGPVQAPDGAWFVGLNLGSNGDGVHAEVRGPWAPHGFTHEDYLQRWSHAKSRIWKMYARVPWRGWVLRIDPATGTAEPWSSGWRSPDGLGFDATGRLLVTDNQGDWIATSSLAVSGRGSFHQHPASLVWEPGASGDPLEADPASFAARRTPPAVLFPHGLMANSPTQPVCDRTGGKFGPFAGQIIVGEMNTPRLLRVMLDDVNGTVQGAVTPFFNGGGLRAGNHRLAFAPDGSLWVGQIHLAWAGGEGLQRLRWTGRTPLEVQHVALRPGGFLLRFTHAIDAASVPPAAAWKIRHYGYKYHADYGSPQVGTTAVTPTAVERREDGRALWIALGEVTAGGRVHEFALPELTAERGALPLVNRTLCYTVNVRP